MRAAAPRPSLWSVAPVIAWREAQISVRGYGGFIALTAALLAATWMIRIDIRALESAGLIIRADPFRTPLATAMLVVALYIGVSASMSVARDRESGTLEVLFYGPVDEISYILGKIGGLLLAYSMALPLLLAFFLLLSGIAGFALSADLFASVALSIVPAAAIISFGVLLSVGTDRVRSAVLLFIAVAALLIGVAIAYRLVLLAPIGDPSSPLLPLRDALAAIDFTIRWISPFAYIERIVSHAASGAWRPALPSLAASAAYSAAMIGFASMWLRRRGVHRRGD